MLVTEDSVIWLFINSHVHRESRWVEIEHHGLFFESESREGTRDHLVDVVVKSLLDIDRW